MFIPSQYDPHSTNEDALFIAMQCGVYYVVLAIEFYIAVKKSLKKDLKKDLKKRIEFSCKITNMLNDKF